jgi:hypothetical protein
MRSLPCERETRTPTALGQREIADEAAIGDCGLGGELIRLVRQPRGRDANARAPL